MVKLGLASEEARSAADETGHTASQQLLSDYSVTPGATPILRTPRTPAGEDTLLQEAQNLIALQNVQTPLKGGENTPLHESLTGTGFEGMQPKRQAIQTPNVVLGTPFRTPGQSGSGSTPRMQTPRAAAGGMTPGQTPVRDQLSINPEDALDDGFERSIKQQQLEMRAQLRTGLMGLPAPRNDFEIVVPENGVILPEAMESDFVEDAAEIDERKAQLRREEGGSCCHGDKVMLPW